RDCAVETLLSRPKYHALTTAADFLQQFVIAQLSQCLGNRRCFLVLASWSRAIHFNIFSRAAVIRLRRDYCGRVAGSYGRIQEQTKTILKKAARAASFRGVDWDFHAALWAKS